MRAYLLLFVCLAAPLSAQDSNQAEIAAAFEGWMQDQEITTASIAVLQDGAPAFTKGYERDADAPVTLASLSKAITGACIAVLQQEAVFDLDAEVADLLNLPQATGTLPDFLTQISGLTPDRTQGKPWHLEDDRAPRHRLAAETALATQRESATFRYNNENYAILGAVIDAVAQQDYETDCRNLVLEPLGITTATLDPVWSSHGAWGGWAMSVGDYARFAHEWFGPERNIGRDPLAWPHTDTGGGAYYGMGTFFRVSPDRNIFWHAGSLCWDDDGDGSYFASYGADPVVVVSFAACLNGPGFRALDEALYNAALP